MVRGSLQALLGCYIKFVTNQPFATPIDKAKAKNYKEITKFRRCSCIIKRLIKCEEFMIWEYVTKLSIYLIYKHIFMYSHTFVIIMLCCSI
jgi:hypothetical protein